MEHNPLLKVQICIKSVVNKDISVRGTDHRITEKEESACAGQPLVPCPKVNCLRWVLGLKEEYIGGQDQGLLHREK